MRDLRVCSIEYINGLLDHGLLLGLDDDDHGQYWADTTIGTRAKNYTTTGSVSATTLTDTVLSISSGIISSLVAIRGDWAWTGSNAILDISDESKTVVLKDNQTSAFSLINVSPGQPFFRVSTETGDATVVFGNATDNPAFSFHGSGVANFTGPVELNQIGPNDNTDPDLIELATGAVDINGDLNMFGDFLNTVPATSVKSFDIDGDTNPYTTVGTTNLFFNDISRTVSDAATGYPGFGVGTSINLSVDTTATGSPANFRIDKQWRALSGGIFIDETLNWTSGGPTGHFIGVKYIGAGYTAQYDSSFTSNHDTTPKNHSFEVDGGFFEAKNNGVFDIQNGTLAVDFVGGELCSTQDTPTFTFGVPTFRYIGLKAVATGETTSDSTSIAGLFSATGSDTNIAIQVDAGTTIFKNGEETRYNIIGDANYVGLKAGVTADDTTYALPIVDGGANDHLITDGSGVMSWTNPHIHGELYIDGGDLITPSVITTTVGTLVTGDIDDVQTVNQTYYQVLENGGAYPVSTIDIDFVLDDEPGKVIMVGRYTGSIAHIVKAQAWNYTTVGWDDFTAVDDFPSTANDAEYTFDYSDLPGAPSDYLSGTASRFRIDHTSNGINSHNFYLDYIAILERGFTVATAGVFETVTDFIAGSSDSVTLNAANGTMTITEAGLYKVDMTVSFAGTDGARFRGNLFVDEVRQANLGSGRRLGTDGDIGTTAFTGIALLEVDDVLTVRVTSNMSGDYASLQNMNWNITKV